MSVLDDASSVLFVHAHPDDETISTGALVAELVTRGIQVSLLTATRGERGEIVPGSLPPLTSMENLSLEREEELRRAVDTLGIEQCSWLGEVPARARGLRPRRYRDSGMSWIRPGLAAPALDVEPAALASAPLEEVTGDIAAFIESIRPSLIVSYDHGGGYGHPDHVRVHDASLAASTATATPFAEVVRSPVPDAEWFVLDNRFEVVSAALRCHASQLTVDGLDIVHSGGQREAIVTSIGLRRRA